MMVPACIHLKHQVDCAIDNSSILYGKDLTKPRGEFLSVYSVMDDCYFTLEEYVVTMEDLFKYPEQGYENLCKDYLNWKEELICCIIEAEKIVKQEEKEQKRSRSYVSSRIGRYCCS